MVANTKDVSALDDPAVSKQWDTETPKVEQVKDFYDLADASGHCMLTTSRPGVGPVARWMVVAKRNGPDFLFLANKNSQKFKDLAHSDVCQITFQGKNFDWISITGKAVSTSNSDPRIKDLHNKFIKAWFGDLGDGTHDGGPDDPRMSLIEVKPTYVAYWKQTVGKLGYLKEITVATATGNVAQTGVQRQLTEVDLDKARNLE